MRTKFKNNTISALDIGSSKILCLIAEIGDDNTIKVCGVGHHISQGFRGTIITDIKLAEASIVSAVYEAEKMAGFSIEKVTLSIDGDSIETEDLEVEMLIDEQVTDKNLKDILLKAINSFNNKTREILHFFPIDYGIDKTFGIKNPVSMVGYSLQVRAKVIYLPVSHAINLTNCLEKCRLNVNNIIVGAYAASFACVSEEEKEQGITLIDIGANTTSIVSFSKGNIFAFGYVPIGGNHITADISYGFALDFSTSERIKIMEGNAFLTSFDNGNMIEIEPKNLEEKREYIATVELSAIIRARLEEILEMTKAKMEEMGVRGLAAKKIVLTGGVSNLTGIKEVASNIFANQIRVVTPKSIESLGSYNLRADFAAAVGVLCFIANHSNKILKEKKKNFKLPNNSFLGKMIKWFKENL